MSPAGGLKSALAGVVWSFFVLVCSLSSWMENGKSIKKEAEKMEDMVPGTLHSGPYHPLSHAQKKVPFGACSQLPWMQGPWPSQPAMKLTKVASGLVVSDSRQGRKWSALPNFSWQSLAGQKCLIDYWQPVMAFQLHQRLCTIISQVVMWLCMISQGLPKSTHLVHCTLYRTILRHSCRQRFH